MSTSVQVILFLFGVATVLCLAFGLLAAATTPGDLDKGLRRRLEAIRSGVGLGSAGADTPEFLKAAAAPAGWLQARLMRYAFGRTLQLYIAQGAGTQTVAGVFLLSLGLAAGGFLATYLLAPVLPLDLAGAAALGCLPAARVAWQRSRRIAEFAAALPDAIDMMARALRAGNSLAGAMEIVAQDCAKPVCTEFGEVFQQQNVGLPLRDALTQMVDRVPSKDLRVVVAAIIVQRDTGGNLVELLDRTAFLIRDRLRIQGEIRTHTAQGRLTGWVLCALPVVLVVLMNVVSPGYSRILLVDPLGRKMIYLGVGLIAVGSFIINRIVNGIDV
jgi:tight adherence protein B